jgi:hypothetical protein
MKEIKTKKVLRQQEVTVCICPECSTEYNSINAAQECRASHGVKQAPKYKVGDVIEFSHTPSDYPVNDISIIREVKHDKCGEVVYVVEMECDSIYEKYVETLIMTAELSEDRRVQLSLIAANLPETLTSTVFFSRSDWCIKARLRK